LAVFNFDAADFRLALEVAAGRCAELAGAVFAEELFAGAFLAAGFFFDDAAGLAVFFADGGFEVVPEPTAAEDCADGFFAARLFPGHSRHVKTAATQDRVLLFGILLRSNQGLGGESRRATLACTRSRERPHFNCKPRSGVVARDAAEGTSRGTSDISLSRPSIAMRARGGESKKTRWLARGNPWP
jgi:hypothetical protein